MRFNIKDTSLSFHSGIGNGCCYGITDIRGIGLAKLRVHGDQRDGFGKRSSKSFLLYRDSPRLEGQILYVVMPV